MAGKILGRAKEKGTPEKDGLPRGRPSQLPELMAWGKRGDESHGPGLQTQRALPMHRPLKHIRMTMTPGWTVEAHSIQFSLCQAPSILYILSVFPKNFAKSSGFSNSTFTDEETEAQIGKILGR